MHHEEENIVDDQGTDQETAKGMLKSFCKNGFDDDLEAVALVLGRPAAELQQIFDGELQVDDDLAMKMKGIAQARGIEITDPPAQSEEASEEKAAANSPE